MLSFLLMNTRHGPKRGGGEGGLLFFQFVEAFLAAATGVEEIGPSIDLGPEGHDFGHIGLAGAAGDPIGVWCIHRELTLFQAFRASSGELWSKAPLILSPQQ